MATFTGTTGTDNFVGSSAADDFYFGIADLNPTDTINGGGTLPGDGVDRLFITSGGAINLLQISTVRRIEEIHLSSAGNTVHLTHELFENLTTGYLSVIGTGVGADDIQAVLHLDGGGSPGMSTVRATDDLFVDAGGGNDNIVAGLGDDTVLGGDGNDNIVAFTNSLDPNVISGSDLIHGNAGNDTIKVGNGSVFGDEGDDHFYFDGDKTPTTTVDGGEGYDVAHGSGFANIEFINVEALKLGGAYTPEELMLFSEILSIRASDGAMLTSSGVVDFTGRVIGNGVRLWCDGGVDGATINGSDFKDSIRGSDGDDSITGGGGSDTLFGADGNDTLSGGLGNDTLSLGASFGSEIALKLGLGGDGDDYFILGYQARGTVDGGAGTDTVELDNSSSHFSDYSSSGIERIVLVDRYQQYFFTESQLASIQSIDFKFDPPGGVWLGLVGGGTFNLSLIDIGGYGFDARALYSPKGGVTINGSAYSDSLQGNSGADRLIAGGGDDRLDAGGGNDSLNGGNGNDTIYAGRGSDTLSGGSGNDTLYLASRVQGTGVAYGGSGNDAFHIDNVLRSTIFGGDGIDTVFGGGDFSAAGVLNAVEVLATGGYFITLRADQLDDFRSILGHASNDIINLKITTGGLLKHWVAIDSSSRLNINASSAAEAIIVTGNNLDDTIIGGLGHDTINGANGSDQLFGRGGNDIINGGAGFDFIVGDAGNDRLSSGTGGGSLHGSNGNDTLEGGSGEDALIGGAGLDLMTGGGGRDKFYFSELIDSRPLSPDVITDFQAGVDRIMLGDLHSGTGYPGQPSGFKFIGTAAFSAEGQVRYVHQNGDTIVQVNIDGTSGSELSILLKGLVNLSVSDFVLVD